jgi:type IV secretory pathway VirB3-like protein
MPWWLWVIIGAIIYAMILLFVWALCKAAGDDDERMGRK